MLKSVIITSAIFSLFSGSALAGSSDLQSLSCGDSSITVGMSSQEIKTSCGAAWKPSYVSEHVRPAPQSAVARGVVNDVYEKWMYHPTNAQETHVVLRNDQVVRIFVAQ